MDVIRHHAVRPYLHTGLSAGLGHQRAVRLVVLLAEERPLSPVAALGYMVRVSGRNDSGQSRHKVIMPGTDNDVLRLPK